MTTTSSTLTLPAGFALDQRVQRPLVILLALVAPIVALSFGKSWVRVLDFAMLYVMLAIGLNLVVGFAGLLDLGYIAFYAVGAYTWAFLASPHFGIHLPFWIVLPLGATFAAVAGIALGFPTLRLRGDYLAIVTLGFGEIIRIFMNNLNQPINITNGPQGIDSIDPLVVGGVDLSMDLSLFGIQTPSVVLYYYAFLVCVVIALILVRRCQISRIGRAWAAIRDDELAAKAIGIDTRAMKLLAFAMGATFGGVAGGLFSAFQGFVSPESFSLTESIVVLTMIVLGGMGNLAGVVVGAVMLTALPELLRHFAVPMQMALFGKTLLDPEVLRMLLLSLAMIVMMLVRPAGLLPARTRYAHRDRRNA
ncbi:branched-chain amino acid ABC transporter system, permease [Azoarcus sp. KH32C]|uniref:ABC transporter permease subunit n=1 Tax=Azoarcus sp. KH32C TaxID=748247 RepID=UPI0002386AB0|nr:branched-chain amino acid ABC transporter system, permease [Azoarcus sp. KH32C]BAL25948.1 branched-chain amino acid ABC transporter system, permease protein [Azoarcus sp. KH32C]